MKFLILKLDFSISRVTQENSKIGNYYATYRRRLRVSRQHDGSRAAIEDSKRGARERHKIRISWPESRGRSNNTAALGINKATRPGDHGTELLSLLST